ncbi:hypothetical protein [Streptomyces zhihengii]
MTEEEVSCLGKDRYPTRRAAKKDASRIRRTGGPNLRPYPCRYCGRHHIGNRPGNATYTRRGTPLQELIQP